ncbi:hypothetical protein H7H73_14650, partial [Mycobacterium rufum]|nr:hypothetical protein [Mycolicibacterium rufum]
MSGSAGTARRPPALLVLPAALVVAATLIPLVYLGDRALSRGWSAVVAEVMQPRTGGAGRPVRAGLDWDVSADVPAGRVARWRMSGYAVKGIARGSTPPRSAPHAVHAFDVDGRRFAAVASTTSRR